MSIYTSYPPPEDHIYLLRHDPSTPQPPKEPSYGIDNPTGLVTSAALSPLYLYTTLKGKFSLWDTLLSELSSTQLHRPVLDVGCGRGVVLLKVAELKRALPWAGTGGGVVYPAYGVDTFTTHAGAHGAHATPLTAYQNAAALRLLDQTVLHTAPFDSLPFADNTFGVVTSSIALHNLDHETQRRAIVEIARVCEPGGKVIIVDLKGSPRKYEDCLRTLGWTEVDREWAGIGAMFGSWPCDIIRARKPFDD